MHNAVLDGLEGAPTYRLHPCEEDALDAALREAERRCRGLNVTAPFKRRVAERYPDALDDAARATGAVNTVVYQDHGRPQALNTDVEGLQVAWRRGAVHIEGAQVAIVGAGGAAAAVVVALKRAGAKSAIVYARRREAASALVALGARVGLDVALADVAQDAASVAVFAASGLDDPAAWPARVLARPGVIHDLRYGLRAQPLMRAALSAGHLFLDGQSMLLAQAQAALSAFLGRALEPTERRSMAHALAQQMRLESSQSA